ncbi:MAG: LD-carboxypeptidase [Paludibacteraceae bacterium]|nr:LD-carboxypeptidase [Paludibacteraceae bacterium]
MSRIRIISPSGVIDPSYMDGATTRLREWGHEVSEGIHARDQWGRFAGTDDDRLADIIDALSDPSVDMLLCARGGYGLQRIIDRIPEIHKPVIGFSDITALHQLSAISGQHSLHGIMCKHIASLPEDSEPLIALRQMLDGNPVDYTIPAHPLNRSGEACAPLVGGNLSVLYGLQGTPYELGKLSYQVPILLIEDISERHYHIDRMIRNLRMSGVLAHLSGLIVGQFTDCEEDPLMLCSVYETINEAVSDYDYPVIFDAPFGHVEDNRPLWLNATTRIEVNPSSALIAVGGIA